MGRVKEMRREAFTLDNGKRALISRRMLPAVRKAYGDFILKRKQAEEAAFPAVINNKNLAAMKLEHGVLETRYWELRERVRKTPGDKDAMAEYLNVSGRKNEIGEAIQELQRDIIDMETAFLEKAGFGDVSPRLTESRRFYESGDLEGAKRLLDLDEMMGEDERYGKLLEEAQKKINEKVNEYLYLADMLKTDVGSPGRFDGIERTYEHAVNLEETHNLRERNAAWKYVNYLYYQNKYEKAADIACRQLSLLEIDNADETEIANYSNFISRCYNRIHRYGDAAEMSRKALAIRERLAAEDPAVYEPDLAKTLDGLARVLEMTGSHEDAEKLRKRALGIYERLAAENPALLPGLAKSYNNIAEMYVEIQRFTECEEYSIRALDIHERLAAENPSVYDADLARSYNDLAFLYSV
jgi:tetratricopeptide (TPR) repeat protein